MKAGWETLSKKQPKFSPDLTAETICSLLSSPPGDYAECFD